MSMSREHGKLIIIGGNEDKNNDCEILKSFIEMAGKDKAKLAVIPTATKEGQVTGETYQDLFYSLGAESVEILYVNSRRDANKTEVMEKLQNSTGVFFTGGDQLRITSLLGGTRIDWLLHEIYSQGVIISGTSAGAAAITDTMIMEGIDESAPAKNSVALAHGLGFLKGAVVDQHFAERGRIGRLLSAVAQNPVVTGMGIDENTAIVVDKDDQIEILGTGTVTIIDGKEIEETNISQEDDNSPLALTNVTVDILSPGSRFDLKKRNLSLQGG